MYIKTLLKFYSTSNNITCTKLLASLLDDVSKILGNFLVNFFRNIFFSCSWMNGFSLKVFLVFRIRTTNNDLATNFHLLLPLSGHRSGKTKHFLQLIIFLMILFASQTAAERKKKEQKVFLENLNWIGQSIKSLNESINF